MRKFLALALIVAACDTDLPEGGPAPGDGGFVDAGPSILCQQAEMHSDLAWIEPNVFDKSCTFSSCHPSLSMGQPQKGLSLAIGESYDHLVNVCSQERAELLVAPGDPTRSYLITKMGGNPAELPEPAAVCVKDLCVGKMCQTGEVCSPIDGECHEDLCATVNCAMDEVCLVENGQCITDECATMNCSSTEICAVGFPYMPLNNPRLCPQKLEAVKRWVTNLGDAGPWTPDGGLVGQPVCCDSMQNGSETDIDCGGGECKKCDDAQMCAGATDCRSGVCDLAAVPPVCLPPACDDTVKNGGESDVDCGGATTCPRCMAGDSCLANADCDTLSGVCRSGQCRPCNDGAMNGNESDVDCGGFCKDCMNGQMCNGNGDCMSGHCTSGMCTAM